MTRQHPPTFAELGLRPDLCSTLSTLGYDTPTPIQAAALPHLLDGKDVIGQAATGTGKTAAFALPIVASLDVATRRPQALVLTPTRELAQQVSEAFFRYGGPLGARTVALVGGQPIGKQLRSLEKGAHVVVATPGRAVDHLERRSLDVSGVRTVVIDEADEMLDMGFADDLDAVFTRLPSDRQTVLFSATLPPKVAKVASRHQRDPVRVDVSEHGSPTSSGELTHVLHIVDRAHKSAALLRVVDMDDPQAIIFCRTRQEVDDVTAALNQAGHAAEGLHGGMDQQQRNRVVQRLKSGVVRLVVATDVAARGLDVDVLTHVINYDVPAAPASFVHRVGRVGRAGRSGTAVTLAEPRQRRLLDNIESELGQALPRRDVPSAADLVARRGERLAASVRSTRPGPSARAALDGLDDLDIEAVALAALELLSARAGGGADSDIPSASLGRQRDRRQDRTQRDQPGRSNARGAHPRAGGRPQPARDGDTAFVHVSAGRKAGVRPADLVGAIANDAGLAGRHVGPIRVLDHYSVVGVPKRSLRKVLGSLDTVRGKEVRTREYRP